MQTPSNTVSLESIQRQLPSGVREAPVEERIEYIRRKKRQFQMLFWLGVGMAILIAILTALSFVLPDLDPDDNLVLSLIIIAAFAGASVGNRKMAQRYAAFESRMALERENP